MNETAIDVTRVIVINVQLSNRHRSIKANAMRLCQAAEAVLKQEGLLHAEVHLALVDDAEIQRVNRQFLHHDRPTDVISFVLEQEEDYLEGEILISLDTAEKCARTYQWSCEEELLLYIIHGTLHLVGYDDLEGEPREKMRQAELRYLKVCGVTPRNTEQLPGPLLEHERETSLHHNNHSASKGEDPS